LTAGAAGPTPLAMKEKLDGSLALVTGAGSGIGRATAHALARARARVIAVDVDGERVERIAAELGARCALARRVDVASRDEMRALATEVHDRFGAVSVVVNNAGVAHSGGMLDSPLEDWEWTVGVNLWGVVHGCHFFVPPMVRAGLRGHVVNVASMYGLFAPSGVGPYCTTKFAVVGLSESLRAELAPHGIGVSVICPGLISTDIIRRARFADESQRAPIAEQFDTRGRSPDAVAKAIVGAIRGNTAVVPVGAEAWIAYAGKRAAPGLTARVTRGVDALVKSALKSS
jgi:NAD(P)-dependent dehydrogenase (short-subunit alcohol dehydrogenase family)